MVAILRRLQFSGIQIPSPCLEETKTWVFSQIIQERGIDFFRYLVQHHQVLSLEYSVCCSQLIRDFLKKDETALLPQLEGALILAELLENLYVHSLNVPRELVRLRRDSAIFRRILTKHGYVFPMSNIPHKTDTQLSSIIRESTFFANIPRNVCARSRRALDLITPIIHAEGYGAWMTRINQIALPILSYAAWIFFTPRLLTNLFLLAKHVIPGAWMSEEEKALGVGVRFNAQMNRRWFELGNDLAWVILGLLNCFWFIGTLGPWGLYGTIILLAYDVVLASIRAFIEINRLETIEQQYVQLLEEASSSEEQEQMENYLIHLRERISFEKKRTGVLVVQTSLLFFAFALSIPFIAFSPIIPLIGAIIAVITTLVCYIISRGLEHLRPVDQMDIIEKRSPSVVPLSLFKPPSPIASDHIVDTYLNEPSAPLVCVP